MAVQIYKAAVLGSGVMGSGIAAHLANIGIPVLLLDMVPKALTNEEKAKGLTLEDKIVRNRIGNEAKQRLLKQKPASLAVKENSSLIEIGNFEDDVQRLHEADWIIEVVVEKLEIKKKIFEQVDRYRRQGTIVSSNTSGISIKKMAEDRSEDFKQHFLGTHFFNPPRYLKLLELIPTKDTKPEIVTTMHKFVEEVLGKGAVLAKDTPNFIANRIGTYGLLAAVQEMIKGGYTIGEVDDMTGPLIGRPKSATFRTLDVVGLDTFIHVANNVFDQVDGKEKEMFKVPEFMKKMAEKSWLGSKSGQGFYLKKKTKDGSEIFELNISSLQYERKKKMKTPSMEAAKRMKSTSEKLRTLLYSGDRAGTFLWEMTKAVLLFSAEKAYEISDSIYAIDQAMKWGFGWELGPFEIWDAVGVEKAVRKMKEAGEEVPEWIEEMLAAGFFSFYSEAEGERSYYHHGKYVPIAENKKVIRLSTLKKQTPVLKKNSGASLVDLEDGVLCLEFHSKSNAIGIDILQMINAAIDEIEQGYAGLVIGNQGKNFCVGANLALMLMEAQDDNYFEIDFMIKMFQRTMSRIRYAKKPVVAAPFGMTLGGGTEVCLPAVGMQASFETYIGLVEVGVGLIPGGGGNKELYMRMSEGLPHGINLDLQRIANKTFEQIAMAKVSSSAQEARKNGFLRESDGITINNDSLLYDAKQKVLQLYNQNFQPRQSKKIQVVGESGYAAMLMGAQSMKYGGYISDHDMKIAKKLAYVIAGGKVAYGTFVEEQYLLDLEREAFLSLIGEPKTQERMQYMLVNGKPLRN
ncbi:3-hydroxyacyl-CoA dehydrogenase/enoyl-CoA hydratase family protein [Bacillus taeanensis]|uniref:3-hydroxyacyl-CoA dehydrogenase n=1 Tax=Bacillus taeanensis TaxID=273032 RepID=A0A366XXX3_9BACI|nr:3-hydroxyacyl-CoA dehydrogenase/enoyl-CoA hydratase family protein [Bacillus taeanensis]RBW71250.1 3-hydroxyacyl-CoA dehydrogenase [Bacillus taeanensis]